MPCALYPKGFWLSACIAEVVGNSNHWVSLKQRLAFEVLERHAGKLARVVLRGLGVSNDPWLPDSIASWGKIPPTYL